MTKKMLRMPRALFLEQLGVGWCITEWLHFGEDEVGWGVGGANKDVQIKRCK